MTTEATTVEAARLVERLRRIPDAQASISVQKLGQDAADALLSLSARIERLEEALREIAYARPVGATPKTVSGALIERIEKIALAALTPKDQP